MAHRIYLYNYDQQTNQTFDTYLGEWNYEIPLLLYPLIAEDIRIEGNDFFSDKEKGVVQLRYFFNLLADTYQLHYKKPNKLHKKSRLIDKSGGIIIDEIDQLLSIERFDTLAICKAKSWRLYHSTKKKFLLEDEYILKVKAEPSAYRK